VQSSFYAEEQPSNLVKEGDFLNVHVTSAPAVVALGLMFLKSSDGEVARWLKPPDNFRSLKAVRPDILLLKTLAYNLVMWREILPRTSWVKGNVPDIVANAVTCFSKYDHLVDDDVDDELISQSYCYIVTGACFSLGFKFAAFKNVMFLHLHDDIFQFSFLKIFLPDARPAHLKPISIRQLVKKAGRYTIESCIGAILLAMGIVMAGTGNLDLLRIIRCCHGRLDFDDSNLCPFHMATHMALGLLFLGGGRFSLKGDNFSIAAMLAAFFPKFPIHLNDNRYHLQALRHLYVFASDFVALSTKDASTNCDVSTDVAVTFKVYTRV
ncbi:unnamed protein product, partial [Soboliphyme baturini]|uniref:Anaphase-promoting complex subunit 1 n=1 Tax=Soboliphyme baturini TaxID=241478 RepID=A0A183IY62_9BILA